MNPLRASLVVVVGIACSKDNPARIASPVSIDSATVFVNGTRLYYEAAGSGAVVVLLHSGNLDRRMWDPQFLAFARDHRVIRYDARSYGRSGPADAPYRGDDDLFALLAALHVSQASLVGSSGGGRIAIDFALKHPEMVDRLVLAAPGMSGWPYRYVDTTWLPAARRANARHDSAGIALAWLEHDFMRAAMEQPQVAAKLREIAAGNGRFWMDVSRYGGEADLQGDPRALHRTNLIQAPTLLIIGSRDGRDLHDLADTLTRSMPHVKRVDFEGAGHLLNMEQPVRFTRLVLDFLR